MDIDQDILLSVVVPSRNRPDYLKHLLDFLLKSQRNNFEILVEDNSEDAKRIDISLDVLRDSRVKYNHNGIRATIDINCDNAIGRARGAFVCMIGDDDGVLIDESLDYLEGIFATDIDAITVNSFYYAWPSVTHRTWGDVGGELFLQSHTKNIRDVNILGARKSVLNHGAAYGIEELPRLYHGFIRRNVLLDLFKEVHTYFPGPSPDMASSFALTKYVSRCIFYDFPLVIAGHSQGSAGGMGSTKTHIGEIANQPHLPGYTIQTWNTSNPFFWSGPTIYAQSAAHVISSIPQFNNLKLNWAYLYAVCFVYESFFWKRIFSAMRLNSRSKVMLVSLVSIYILKITARRVLTFSKNIFKFKLHRNNNISASTLEEAIETFRRRI